MNEKIVREKQIIKTGTFFYLPLIICCVGKTVRNRYVTEYFDSEMCKLINLLRAL